MISPRLTGSSAPLQFTSFGDVSHGISTRLGGVSRGPYSSLNLGMSTCDPPSNVSRNRDIFFDALGLDSRDVVVGRLSHGNKVSVFAHGRDVPHAPGMDGALRESSAGLTSFCSDAVISNTRGLHFMITAADCVPLAFLDAARGVVGAAHAGWRGTSASIASEVIRAMEQSFGTDPGRVVVGIGPSVGPCCYSVSQEVLETFKARGQQPVVQQRDGKHFLDLWATNTTQLIHSGVPAESIENFRQCTACNADKFFSHRAEAGLTGRFALCIGQ